MNRRMIMYTLGYIMGFEAALLILPLAVSLIYGEDCWLSFLITIAICVALALPMRFLSKPRNHIIYAREGFIIVSFAWIFLSAAGALPFVISGEIPNYIDALFETASGFSTTGASIVRDVEVLSHGILFWRSFTHWVGGMGVLVFIVAIMPNVADRSIHILRAEMPGPTMGKLVPKLKDTAKILYIIYIVLTVVEMVMLYFGGMSIFESVVHSFGTAGTGGFGVKGDSITGYSPYIQWVITVFMALFGVNFNVYFLILIGKFKSVIKSGELWTYICILLGCTAVIAANIYPIYGNLSQTLRLSAFQVSSIATTTGYATADFIHWPELSKAVLFILMFIGGCAGSTAGGLKLTRAIMLIKSIKKEYKRLIHPRSVNIARFEGKRIDEATLNNVCVYFGIYMIIIFAVFLLLCLEKNFDFESNLSASVACFNNIGPGLGLVGPASNYADYSMFSKLVLTFAMLLGRLEIFPMFIALNTSMLINKK
ncbi:MAG: TrkH family potassium uptake protein [Clostridia bacterium]|nr:TrkH family potassium uptake protein [Clostridia bacterium]